MIMLERDVDCSHAGGGRLNLGGYEERSGEKMDLEDQSYQCDEFKTMGDIGTAPEEALGKTRAFGGGTKNGSNIVVALNISLLSEVIVTTVGLE
jgi:hypothetical protein